MLNDPYNPTSNKTASRMTGDKRGRFGKKVLIPNVYEELYVVPDSAVYSCVCINAANNGNSDVQVAFWITEVSSGAPPPIDLIEPLILLKPGAVYIRTGMLLSSKERMVFQADGANITVRIEGSEDRVV